MPFDAQVHAFLLDINLGMELLGHRVGVYSVSNFGQSGSME